MDKPWSEVVYTAIENARTDVKDVHDKFWTYEQQMTRRDVAQHSRIAKLEEEKAQLEEQIKQMTEKANHEPSGTSLWLSMKENEGLRERIKDLISTVQDSEKRLAAQTDMRKVAEQRFHEKRVEFNHLEERFKEIVKEKDQAVQRAQNSNEMALNCQGLLLSEEKKVRELIVEVENWRKALEASNSRCEALRKELEKLKAFPSLTIESEWKLRLAEMNALREAEQETRLATESELERIKKALSGCKEQMLVLAGVMGKV